VPSLDRGPRATLLRSLNQRVTDPALLWLFGGAAFAAIDATGVGEVAPLLGARLDVQAVDPHGRGAQEAQLDGRLRFGDLDELDLGLDLKLPREPLDERTRRLVVRAASK
jgi:hypothetical protein